MGTWADENLESLSAAELEQYAHVVASENPDLIKYFVESLPMPAPLCDFPVAQRMVQYAQRARKRWTVRSGNQ